jgi:predicted TIM-barrel fold metal-dependent hydrolase
VNPGRAESANDLRLADYRPVSRLRAAQHRVERPRFGIVDAHNHLGPAFSGGWHERSVDDLLAALDEAGVETVVDLDVEQGVGFEGRVARYGAAHPSRFVHFAGLAFDAWPERPDFGVMEAGRFEDAARLGARGLKAWKPLGLRARDPEGRVVAVDDERLDPLWAMGARLGLPIVVHVADPIAFFDPLDERNERWEELAAHPDWHFWPPRGSEAARTASPADPDAGFTPFDEILAAFDRVIGRHPETTFIGAHVGCAAEDLALVSGMLDHHPNYHVDIAGRLGELGRQPYTSRTFFLHYADRILFGTDLGYDPEMYRLHYRFLETFDESFDYSTDEVPPQGRWQVHGLGLPDDVLRKVYAENARRLILEGG